MTTPTIPENIKKELDDLWVGMDRLINRINKLENNNIPLEARVILQGNTLNKEDIERQIIENAEKELNTALKNYDYQTAQFMLDTLRLYKFKQYPLSK